MEICFFHVHAHDLPLPFGKAFFMCFFFSGRFACCNMHNGFQAQVRDFSLLVTVEGRQVREMGTIEDAQRG